MDPTAEAVLKYETTGDPSDLHYAIDVARESIVSLADGRASPRQLSNLGNALRTRYEIWGRLADLHEAVTHARHAVDLTSASHPARAPRLANLSYSLRLRFERAGDLRDIDQSIAAGREALKSVAAQDSARARHESNLGVALRERHEHTHSITDLHEAVELASRAMNGTPPDHPDQPGMLSNLGLALHQLHEAEGGTENLRHAISTGRLALQLTPSEHPDRAMFALNLAIQLRALATTDPTHERLDEAVDAAAHAVALFPDSHPDRAAALSVFGRSLRLRYQHLGDAHDASAAVEARRQAASVRTAPPAVRVLAAHAMAEWAVEDHEMPTAEAAYATAVELLAEVAWHGLERPVRQAHLSAWRGLAEDATACALAIRRHERAVELLEQGRTVLWTQRLHHRTDLRCLRAANSAIAERLDEIRSELDQSVTAIAE